MEVVRWVVGAREIETGGMRRRKVLVWVDFHESPSAWRWHGMFCMTDGSFIIHASMLAWKGE